MKNKLRRIFVQLVGQLLGRIRLQVAAQPIVMPIAPHSQGSSENESTDNGTGFDPMRDAANSAFAGQHGEDQIIEFQRGDSPQVFQRSENWVYENDGLHSSVKNGVVITCSGVAVLPASVEGICAVGGMLDTQLSRCHQCGILLCPKHTRMLDTQQGALVLCPKHMSDTLKNWNTWVNGIPGQPHSVSVARIQKGHHEKQ